MNKTVFTIGYGALKTVEQLKEIADEYGAVIVDIRISARSRNPIWNKGYLVERLGDQYTTCRAFGNKNLHGEFGSGIILLDEDKGTEEIERLLETSPVVLMCACRDWHECHRQTVAELLHERLGVEIEHLPGPVVKKPKDEATQVTFW